ncbi:winged helix-turn-helix transcriptional regulator [Parafrigoribacterium soli]|uniref:winged helix-turn-helix transcriptional regulator n=1 Tax=Parafrigoribacterium soli TaxID=3144663 RepID=UPI0032ED7B5D
MAARNYGQYCGVVTALDLIGERWALLIVRDLLVGPRRYSDLKAGLPRIPTNILSTRLKELQQAGVVRRLPMAHGLAYALTDYGKGLEDVVLALGRWGFQAMGEPAEGDIVTSDSMTMAFRTAYRADAAAAFPTTAYEVHIGEVALGLRAGVGGLLVAPHPLGLAAGVDPVAGGADLAFAAGPGIRSLISGELSAREAIASETVHILSGEPALLDRFAATFHLEPPAT